jgi:uncharacterized OsmC-like protein
MIIEYAGGRKLIARHRGLQVLSDQPESGGGENTAMTPTELFVASLALCVGAFVVYFAQRHDIQLEGMKIETDYQMSDNPRRVGAIQVRVHMPGPVSERHQAALQRTAEHCVVHNTLHEPPDVVISVA